MEREVMTKKAKKPKRKPGTAQATQTKKINVKKNHVNIWVFPGLVLVGKTVPIRLGHLSLSRWIGGRVDVDVVVVVLCGGGCIVRSVLVCRRCSGGCCCCGAVPCVGDKGKAQSPVRTPKLVPMLMLKLAQMRILTIVPTMATYDDGANNDAEAGANADAEAGE